MYILLFSFDLYFHNRFKKDRSINLHDPNISLIIPPSQYQYLSIPLHIWLSAYLYSAFSLSVYPTYVGIYSSIQEMLVHPTHNIFKGTSCNICFSKIIKSVQSRISYISFYLNLKITCISCFVNYYWICTQEKFW